MKNKKQISVISAVAGVCILSTAAFASYQTANGYDSLKKSLINTKDIKNCTTSLSMNINVDGKELATASVLNKFDGPNKMNYSEEKETYLNQQDYASTEYMYDDKIFYASTDESGNPFYYSYDYFLGDSENLWRLNDDDSATADKVIRFMELAADTVIGDLRNNFICTEDNDDYTAYSVTLDAVQIPEIVNAGLSMVFSLANNSMYYSADYQSSESIGGADGPTAVYVTADDGSQIQLTTDNSDYYVALLGDDPAVENVTLNFNVGKDGVFRDGTMNVQFEGNGHVMNCNIALSISDINATTIEKLDPSQVTIKTYDDDGNLVDVK